MSDHDQGGERVADYSIASDEERERVVDILLRNKKSMLKRKLVKDVSGFERMVDDFIQRIRQGAVFRGKDFDTLLKIFRQRPM